MIFRILQHLKLCLEIRLRSLSQFDFFICQFRSPCTNQKRYLACFVAFLHLAIINLFTWQITRQNYRPAIKVHYICLFLHVLTFLKHGYWNTAQLSSYSNWYFSLWRSCKSIHHLIIRVLGLVLSRYLDRFHQSYSFLRLGFY